MAKVRLPSGRAVDRATYDHPRQSETPKGVRPALAGDDHGVGNAETPTCEYAALLCGAVRSYSFPSVTFDFRDGVERQHTDMRGVEQAIGESLRSDDIDAVRNGLSNVLYWGWARQPGLRNHKVSAFRTTVGQGDGRLVRFRELVKSWRWRNNGSQRTARSAADDTPPIAQRLRALTSLELPQFGRMSFATKILMFLNPENCPVVDLKIARAFANLEDFAPLKGLTFGTGIPVTAGNAACYERWALWCRCTAELVNEAPESPCRGLRAVDVERALFTLADAGRSDEARTLLAGPEGRDCDAHG